MKSLDVVPVGFLSFLKLSVASVRFARIKDEPFEA